MKEIMILILAAFAVLSSCKKEDNKFEEYQGSWPGTYSGGDSREWEVSVNSEGEVSGMAHSDSLPEFPFDIDGHVTESGALNAEAKVFIGTIAFEGELSGSSASGTWENAEAEIEVT